MNGIGTIINILAVIVGGGFGLIFRGRMKVRYQQIISQAVGLALICVGLYTFIDTYFVVTAGKVELDGIFLVIFALLCGLALGIAINIEELLTKWGKALSVKANHEQTIDDKRHEKLQDEVNKAVIKGNPTPKIPLLDRSNIYEMPSVRSGNLYADGFVIALMLLCVNPMLLTGIYECCLNNDTSLLLIKSNIDFAAALILAFMYGSGILYAAIPLAIIEVFWTILFLVVNFFPLSGIADFVLNLMTPTLMDQLSLIGATLLIGTGVCLAFEKKLKVANLLPAFIVPVIYEAIMMYVDKLLDK